MAKTKNKVLVTGANGFIALHCILELLNNGYLVKGSIRNLEYADKVKKSFRKNINIKNLELCKLDLLKDDGWEEAICDCDYLLHIASPCVINEPKNENQIIEQAIQGTLRALKFANQFKINKVVITSSIGAIAFGSKKRIYDKNDWTDINKYVGTYIKSKTLAERAAWDFISQKNPSFSMTIINPGMVFGPLLNNDSEGVSVKLIKNMIMGKFPALPKIFFTVVDVRDVAKIHIKSLQINKSDQKRIIVTSPNTISFMEISNILRELGFKKAPKTFVPNLLIRFLSIFNQDMKTSLAMINRGCFSVDVAETISIYEWDPIPIEKTLDDMIESFKYFSII